MGQVRNHAAETVPGADIDRMVDRLIPGADEATDRRFGPFRDETSDLVGCVVEIDVTRDQPLGLGDVHFSRWYALLRQPCVRIVDRPPGFGCDDHVLMPGFREGFERLERPPIQIEVTKDAPTAVALRPSPELPVVGEVRQGVESVPRLNGVEGHLGVELGVVAVDPAGVEVGDDAVEVDAEAEGLHR